MNSTIDNQVDDLADPQPAGLKTRAPQGSADAASRVPTADSPRAVPTGLDMERVARWARLLDGDPQARAWMTRQLAGQRLSEQEARIAELQRQSVARKYGISAELAEVHLTATDPEALERQAQSLAEIVASHKPFDSGRGGAPSPPTVDEASLGADSAAPLQGTSLVHGSQPTLPSYGGVHSEELLEQQFASLYQAEGL